MPMKKKLLDVNNLNDKKRKSDHMFSDIFGKSSKGVRSMNKIPELKQEEDNEYNIAAEITKNQP